MPDSGSSWRVLPFPRERKLVIDALRYGKRKHTIHGLIEVDVTEARARIRRMETDTDQLSFTAFVVYCLANAISEHEMLAPSYRRSMTAPLMKPAKSWRRSRRTGPARRSS